jgi:hypothetical protein
MPMNPWITNSFLDSCAFDPKYHPEDQAANELFRLHQTEHLGIILAHSNQKEVDHPNTPAWVKAKAAGLIYTTSVMLTSGESSRLNRIQAILAGNGKPENVADDARHVFEAQKYGSYFITTDERLLKRAEAIRTECTVDILRPSQFLELVGKCVPPDSR